MACLLLIASPCAADDIDSPGMTTFGDYSLRGEEEPAIVMSGVADSLFAPHLPRNLVAIDPPKGLRKEEDVPGFGDWLGYDSKQSDLTWLADEAFGMFSLESYPNLRVNQDAGISIGTGFHFLNGPLNPNVNPRLYDFQLAYQSRKIRSDSFIFDLKISVGAYSDFEGSARKGIRFPSHAVVYNALTPGLLAVWGVDVLDRDDISWLPVGGFVWKPSDRWLYEIVFPHPRIQRRISQSHVLYMAGELGGGTWAIERDQSNDNMTYKDLRLLVGIRNFTDASRALEVGWSFDRSLRFRSQIGDQNFDDALILRLRAFY